VTEIPHFDLPFRYVGGKAAVVEQDSPRDIQNCVEAVIRTHKGQRESLPDFGLQDYTFTVMPIDPGSLASIVEAQEPRAIVLAQEAPDDFDMLLDRVRISVEAREGK
jgi:phage baseplate assembly protein W